MKTRCDEYIKLILTKLKQFQHTSRAINEIKRCLSQKSRRHYTRKKMAKRNTKLWGLFFLNVNEMQWTKTLQKVQYNICPSDQFPTPLLIIFINVMCKYILHPS